MNDSQTCCTNNSFIIACYSACIKGHLIQRKSINWFLPVKMVAKSVAFTLLAVFLVEVYGHGKVIDPMHRGGAWRLGFNTPENYNDNEMFCGGFGIQYGKNGGKCGVCGDDWSLPQPRDNENGGLYGTGTIVKTYKSGETIDVVVHLSASHLGYFEFSLCPLESSSDLETEECFEKYLLRQPSGETKFPVIKSGQQKLKVPLVLPEGLTCEHCTFRWHYRTGNSWGDCGDGTGDLGCGDQEIFRSCSDIKIE